MSAMLNRPAIIPQISDLLHRASEDGQSISPLSALSTTECDNLLDLVRCNDDMGAVNVELAESVSCEALQVAVAGKDGPRHSPLMCGETIDVDPVRQEKSNIGTCADSNTARAVRSALGAKTAVSWLQAVLAQLNDRCAEICDLAWHELGETITYRGRPLAAQLPNEAVEAATLRREQEK